MSFVLVAPVVALVAAGCGGDRPDALERKAIAEEGFIYGLPIVMNYAVQYSFVVDSAGAEYKAPYNVVSNQARVFTWQDTTVVTPNSDTPYSMLWLDLRAEPVVISVPAVDPTRYYSVQMVDGNTFNYGYIGSRATGSEAGSYLVAGPDWQGEAPAGIKQVFHATTQFGLTIFRTQLFGPDDMPNVVKVQAGYKVQPLSAFLGQPAATPAPTVDWPKIDAEMVKTNFFGYLAFAMQFAPAGPEEVAIRERLASIGVRPGEPFDFEALPADEKLEIGLGMKEGEKKVEEAVTTIGTEQNGWKVGAAFGDRAFYNGNWVLRAAAAKAGIFGNDAVEAMYPMTKALPDGTALDASQHNYTLTFPAGQLPPVNAFWSVTMYDGKTQFLIKNPIDRYLINSPMLPGLTQNADGSLTIYIQKDSPGKDKESNWLPAPDGPIYMVMRLYWPKTEAPSILPPGKGSWQPPAVVVAD
ncbi:MAG TPA: DUF1254 domain-containing protein [Gemmatimonadales bacterium]|nr:DUF1254 domain-containing protein [Gemmatimonadales bacterium]